MDAWPTARAAGPVLTGGEGELLSITITLEPRLLEPLLDALAGLNFPINPQIYHEAAVVYVYPDGREQAEPATMVEFPAYAGRLFEVREVLARLGLNCGALSYKHILEGLRSDFDVRPAPPGAPYAMTIRYRHGAGRLRAGPPNPQ